eukprot:765530-Hanusia_phi.AAC.2
MEEVDQDMRSAEQDNEDEDLPMAHVKKSGLAHLEKGIERGGQRIRTALHGISRSKPSKDYEVLVPDASDGYRLPQKPTFCDYILHPYR